MINYFNEVLTGLGISKVKLAKYLGVSRQMLYNYLSLESLEDWPEDKKIKIKNILDCKKIEDIYDYYYDGSVVCKEFKIDLKDKRISFMINEYKFTFNLLTGEIKKIFDTKKMLEIKRS